MRIGKFIILFLSCAFVCQTKAQQEFAPIEEDLKVKVTFYKKVQKEFYQGDSITVIIMPELPVYPPLKFKNRREVSRRLHHCNHHAGTSGLPAAQIQEQKRSNAV